MEKPAPSGDDVVVSGMDRPVTPPPRRLRRAALIAVVLVAGAAASAAYVRFGLTRTLTLEAHRVVISPVESGLFTEYIPAEGRVVPRTTAYLDAVEGGQVAEVLVEEGARVEKGQTLVRLQNINLQLEVLGRQAQLMEQLDRLNATILSFEQARLAHERDLIDTGAQVEQLTQRLRRREALRATGAVSQAELDELHIELDRNRRLLVTMREAQEVDRKFRTEQIAQLQEAVRTTRENLAMAGQTLESLSVRAPISGQLSSLDAELGEAKATGQRMGQIDDTSSYKVEADIDEFYLGRVQPGQAVTAEYDGREYRLTVQKVYPQVRDRRFRVDLEFVGSPPGALRRGQSMQVRIELSAARESLVLANGPFYEDTGGEWVFVLSADGTEATRRPVRLGRRGAESIEVVSGLRAGERVVTSSYEALRDFDRIRLTHSTD